MEVFKQLTWTPALDDMIDNEFVNVERLEQDSAMYRLMYGTFTDPMKDLHEDFLSSITPENINHAKLHAQEVAQTMREQAASTAAAKSQGPQVDVIQPELKRCYVPAVYKPPFRLPRVSSLTREQQALCLKIILNFSRNCKPENLSAADKEELKTYLGLQQIINDEQNEFLDVAKKNWDGTNIKIVREDLINLKWEAKIKRIEKLPRYYTEAGTIAFIHNQAINLNFHATVLATGKLPRLILPTMIRRCIVSPDTPKIKSKYFSSFKLSSENNVSSDVNCENLLHTHEVDLVISSSGLNCLATNLDTNHINAWMLPVVVKEKNGKNIVFIDKPLPPTAKNVLNKNSWVYKYILKNYVIHPLHMSSINLDDIGAEHLNAKHSDSAVDDIFCTNEDAQEDYESNNWRNAQYNVFSIGACGSVQNELMKDKLERDYKILVRTKIDGIEKLKVGEMTRVKVAAKLEYQTALASEAVTLDEASKQWISLKFTPDTTLIRARIDMKNSEFLQIERRTCTSINNEMQRLYNVRGEDTLALIYNITDTMHKLAPGRYLLRHLVQNGAFATIYKEVPFCKENCIDLQAIYCDDEFRTIPNPPWPLLDKTLPTPGTKHFNRMPSMFYPSRFTPRDRKNSKNQLNNVKKAKKSPREKNKTKGK